MIASMLIATKYCELSPIELEGLEVLMKSKVKRSNIIKR